MSKGIVIVGGGQAAASAAVKVRELDADIPLTMICAENVLPYQRPPLSKKYLSGEMPLERLILRSQEWFDDQNVSVRLGQAATAIDAEGKLVSLADGSTLPYESLLLATGSHPRYLPDAIGGCLPGIHALRSKEDADQLAPGLMKARDVVVVGGGYIGLEGAAIARQSGAAVTVLEMGERILQRVAAEETSRFFRDLHQRQGVTICEGVALSNIQQGSNGRLIVGLSEGNGIEADCVLCGIGILPNSELAERAGIQCDNGILVDEFCETSLAGIYAAGDCTNFPHKGQRLRLESVPHAIHQAETAIQNMLGQKQSYLAQPWFWSDQYDVKLQIAGLNLGHNHCITRLGKREGSQSVWYYRDEQLLAVDAMNDAPSFMMARRVLESGGNIPQAAAADPAANLKDFL